MKTDTFTQPAVIGLPIADRQVSHHFYTQALELNAVGQPGDDGIPEPLQIALHTGLHLMLVPVVGFGWIIGGREVAPRNHSECVINVGVATPDAVDALVAKARDGGAEIVTAPGAQPWGYAGAFADPDGHVFMVAATG